MNGDKGKRLRELQLAFIGKMLAGVTHEFKNHLAVIKELSGLMGDLLNAESHEEGRNYERYLEIVAAQAGRAAMAAEMAGYLNRFAHRLDEPYTFFDINEILEEEFSLLAWLARQKDMELETLLTDGLPSVYNNPVLVQYVIFSLITSCFARSAGKNRVQAITKLRTGKVTIEIRCLGDRKADSEEKEILHMEKTLRPAFAELKTELSHCVLENGEQTFSFVLPSVSD